MMCLLLFFILFWGWSVRVVRGLVRRHSADPVRGGGPRTGGQCFRVTLINYIASNSLAFASSCYLVFASSRSRKIL